MKKNLLIYAFAGAVMVLSMYYTGHFQPAMLMVYFAGGLLTVVSTSLSTDMRHQNELRRHVYKVSQDLSQEIFEQQFKWRSFEFDGHKCPNCKRQPHIGDCVEHAIKQTAQRCIQLIKDEPIMPNSIFHDLGFLSALTFTFWMVVHPYENARRGGRTMACVSIRRLREEFKVSV